MKKLIMLLAVCSAAAAYGAASHHHVNADKEVALAHQNKLDHKAAREAQAKEWGGKYHGKGKYTDMPAIHSSQLPVLD